MSGSRRALKLALTRLFGLLIVLVAAPAAAHQTSRSYSTIDVDADGTIHYKLRAAAMDYMEVVEVDIYEATNPVRADDPESPAKQAHGIERVYKYVLDRVHITSADGTPCEIVRKGMSADEKSEWMEVLWDARCHAGVASLDFQLFFDIDEGHVGWTTIHQGGRTIQDRLVKGESRRPLVAENGLTALDYVPTGIEHIFGGLDHIAFLLCLLLVAPMRRRDDGSWETRGVKSGLLYVARIVTAFTIAHSITLIAASLDYVSLSSRLVESVIAASILYVAVENIVRGDPKWRWVLTFVFGLIHGLGFASVLRPMLPPTDVTLPLLAFNVGVELGQLAILLVVYPVLLFVARRSGDAYRRFVVLGGSTFIGLFGLQWLIERAFEVKLLSRFFNI